MSEQKKYEEIPELEALFLNTVLYKRFRIDSKKIEYVKRFNGTLDIHCVECNQTSVFQRVSDNIPKPKAPNLDGGARSGVRYPDLKTSERKPTKPEIFVVKFECSRNQTHEAIYIFRVNGSSFCKIGESPSRADVQSLGLKKYKKTLGDPYYKELRQAVYLVSHNVGIGSFVYLRRVFIQVLEDVAQQKAAEEESWDITKWRNKQRRKQMEELEDRLPSSFVRNQVFYRIVSKGIHQLDEDECLGYFDVLKTAITMILDEKIAKEQKRKDRDTIQGQLSQINADLEKN